jgi:hypothetical protein
VSENRVLRGMFGPRREEVEGVWRRLQSEELHNLYASPNNNRVMKSRRMRWAGHVVPFGGMRNAYKIFLGKPEGKRPLGRTGRRWKDNIGMDLRKIEWKGVDWIHLAQNGDQ